MVLGGADDVAVRVLDRVYAQAIDGIIGQSQVLDDHLTIAVLNDGERIVDPGFTDDGVIQFWTEDYEGAHEDRN